MSDGQPQCLAILNVDGGLRTSQQFKTAMSSLMGDIAAGRISEGRANAICNAGGKLLKAVELEQRFGVRAPGADRKVLQLTEEL